VEPLLSPMCREIFVCGDVPSALLTKLAVNLFLITMVTGLAESVAFARGQGLDLEIFRAALDAGPMSSSVSRGKLAKMVAEDFTPQAAIQDVLKNARLVAEQAREAGLSSPLLGICEKLYAQAAAVGLGAEDMAAVVRALEHSCHSPAPSGT
jgi:3-hydroxyisobutyrate dehydrogenase